MAFFQLHHILFSIQDVFFKEAYIDENNKNEERYRGKYRNVDTLFIYRNGN